MSKDSQSERNALELVALRGGSESIMNDLFTQYNRSLLYFAKSIVRNQEVAEEIVSDSFIKLWKVRADFQKQDSIKAFLYIVTKNACLNHIKAAPSRIQFQHEYDETLASTDPGIYANIVRAELLQRIYDEVTKLPEKQREVFRLSFEDLTTEEICERLGMRATAVFANRSRALESLRKVFKNKELLFLLCILGFVN